METLIFVQFAVCAAVIMWMYRRQARRTQQLLDEKRRSASDASMLRQVVSSARDGILIQDKQARILWASPSWYKMFGYQMDEVIGEKPANLIIPFGSRDAPEEIEAFEYDFEDGFGETYEVVQNVTKDGTLRWSGLSYAHHRSDDGDDRVVVIYRDVREQVEHEAALRKSNEEAAFRAEHDALTSTANRVKLQNFYEETREKAARNDQLFGLLHIDLDYFKNINDTYGHSAGDAVIVECANRMQCSIREIDLLARIGGDEFVVVCPGVDSYETMSVIGERIVDAIKQPIVWQDKYLQTGASIGAALSRPDHDSYDALVQDADIALYEAKKAGRGRFAFYDDAMDRSHINRTAIATHLARAIEKDEFEIVLHPQYSLLGKTVTGFEALIRWRHPERGLISPSEFLDVATEIGVIVDIDRIAVSKAASALSQLEKAGHYGLQISVNASADSICQRSYTDFVKWETERYGLQPDRFGIEVLETTLFAKGDNLAEMTIANLVAAGFRVELDDFGTGYAGLAHLGRLRVDGIKIDQSMIVDLDKSGTNQTIVKATVELCRDLGLGVIAEGVNSLTQAQLLRQFGCINVQGHGVAAAMPLEEILIWLEKTDLDAIFGQGKIGAA